MAANRIEIVQITIDGNRLSVQNDRPLIKCIQGAGINMPNLCYDERLTGFSSCDLCIVEVEGISGFVHSCIKKPTDGMVITTNSTRIRDARRMALELLLSDHYANCISPCKIKTKNVKIKKFISRRSDFISSHSKAALCIREVESSRFHNKETVFFTPESAECNICHCKKFSSCKLRKLTVEYNVNPGRHEGEYHDYKIRLLNPRLELDMNKCIRCAKCIRICEEVEKAGILGFIYRGFDTDIYYMAGSEEKEKQCQKCIEKGAKCVEVCPTGALQQL